MWLGRLRTITLNRRFQFQILPEHPAFIRHKQQTCGIHITHQCLKKQKHELSEEPYKFTTSNANTPTYNPNKNRNPYERYIIGASLTTFVIYFLYLREENDIDEMLNVSLFERVPSLEEPHLIQAIPRMKDMGLDTSEAEARLKELTERRLAKENHKLSE